MSCKMAGDILYFELSYKHDAGFWFAIAADCVGKKGTYDFLKQRFDQIRWTWEDSSTIGDDVKAQPYTFDKGEYGKLKHFVSTDRREWNAEPPEGVVCGGYLFPHNFCARRVTVTDPRKSS